jgi:hypothetical protein
MDTIFSGDQKIKLNQLFTECLPVMTEIETLSGGLTDTIKAVGEELEIKPSILKRAMKIAHKASLGQTNVDHDALNTVLEAVGKTL